MENVGLVITRAYTKSMALPWLQASNCIISGWFGSESMGHKAGEIQFGLYSGVHRKVLWGENGVTSSVKAMRDKWDFVRKCTNTLLVPIQKSALQLEYLGYPTTQSAHLYLLLHDTLTKCVVST